MGLPYFCRGVKNDLWLKIWNVFDSRSCSKFELRISPILGWREVSLATLSRIESWLIAEEFEERSYKNNDLLAVQNTLAIILNFVDTEVSGIGHSHRRIFAWRRTSRGICQKCRNLSN